MPADAGRGAVRRDLGVTSGHARRHRSLLDRRRAGAGGGRPRSAPRRRMPCTTADHETFHRLRGGARRLGRVRRARAGASAATPGFPPASAAPPPGPESVGAAGPSAAAASTAPTPPNSAPPAAAPPTSMPITHAAPAGGTATQVPARRRQGGAVARQGGDRARRDAEIVLVEREIAERKSPAFQFRSRIRTQVAVASKPLPRGCHANRGQRGRTGTIQDTSAA